MDSIFVNAMALVYGAGGLAVMLYGCDWKHSGCRWNGFSVVQVLSRNAGKAGGNETV